jgi:hypothetical protein
MLRARLGGRDVQMTEQMYAPEAFLLVRDHMEAVLLVQDHLMELIDCYAGLRPNETQRNAALHAFATVLSPPERTIVNTFIEGGSDPILGEGTGAKYMTDVELIFEECRVGPPPAHVQFGDFGTNRSCRDIQR